MGMCLCKSVLVGPLIVRQPANRKTLSTRPEIHQCKSRPDFLLHDDACEIILRHKPHFGCRIHTKNSPGSDGAGFCVDV